VLLQFDKIIFEQYENYIKQSYRNRCYINTAQGLERLVIPLTSKHGKVLIKDIQIDYTQKWQNNHWRTIESAYRKSPYFEYYEQDLKKILFHNHQFLFDLNMELLSFCLKSLKHKPKIDVSLTYEKSPKENILNLRAVINAKEPYFERNFYQPAKYQQVFGNEFEANLSLIDLLFCEGPNAGSILRASQKGYLNK
jgi:hypothetical protein